MAEINNDALFRVLLGSQKNLDEVLREASSEITKIGRRNTTVVRRVIKRDGVSSTKLYDLPLKKSAVRG
ncbi:hypothetical protein [Comamonas sp. C24C]